MNGLWDEFRGLNYAISSQKPNVGSLGKQFEYQMNVNFSLFLAAHGKSWWPNTKPVTVVSHYTNRDMNPAAQCCRLCAFVLFLSTPLECKPSIGRRARLPVALYATQSKHCNFIHTRGGLCFRIHSFCHYCWGTLGASHIICVLRI